MSRLNIKIDKELISEAIRLSGLKTQREAVNAALRFHLQSKKEKKVKQTKDENQH